MKTRSIGIRLPIDIWNLVKAVDPELTYSEIVKRALLEVYDPEMVDLDGSVLKPTESIAEAALDDIRNVIDGWEAAGYEPYSC